MKKYLLSVLLLLTLFLSACGQDRPSGQTSQRDKPQVTVTTSFLQDMVTVLAGDLVEVETLIPAGEDPHLYLAKASDLQKLQSADLVLYHGLHFEGKMIDALENIGVAVTEDFSHEDLGEFAENGNIVVDPHFWFDIKLYQQAVTKAATALKNLLPDYAKVIGQNEVAYQKELLALDQWCRDELANISPDKRYLITPHDAFNYFARSYGFTLHAPQGLSTDSEVANSDMIATVDVIIDHGVKAIFTESTTNPSRMEKLQEAVAARGGQVTVVSGEGEELFSDSLAPKGQDGDSYVEMYHHNVALIVRYLKD